eukprot:GCRY01001127.1.p1 GENE.GCRY01001127.1~~GCRY01001127.1.p1  ORF type:complete len:363 (-),score=33.10 GCRY01001127.1:499-1587(-)
MVEEQKAEQVDFQQYHAGRTWATLQHYVEDFTVTINGLQAPPEAIDAARVALGGVMHYPSHDQEPAHSSICRFLDSNKWDSLRKRSCMGNGASELIDLVTRLAPRGPFRPGPVLTQYKEYERSALVDGRQVLSFEDPTPATLTVLINPCNPTGDFWTLDEMKLFIKDHVANDSFFVVDESMLLWYGPNWREHSLVFQQEYVQSLLQERGIKVFVIYSWTKIWACPGIRIGTIVAPTEEDLLAVKARQVPWSVSVAAIAFADAVCKDQTYMESTWELTPGWREKMVEELQIIQPGWKIYGESWLSWIWIDTGSAEAAQQAYDRCNEAGVPIRHGKDGYKFPTYIRLAVRPWKTAEVVMDALKF